MYRETLKHVKVISFPLVGVMVAVLALLLVRNPVTVKNLAVEKSSTGVFTKPLTIKQQEKDDVYPHEYIPGRLIVKFKNISISSDSKVKALAFSPDSINGNSSSVRQIKDLFSQYKVSEIQQLPFSTGQSSIVKLTFDASANLDKASDVLKKNKDVEYVEHDYLAYPLGTISDEYFLDRNPPSVARELPVDWGKYDPPFDYQWNLKAISYPDVLPKSEKPIVVAVIDTGVDYNHVELKDAIWKNTSEIRDNGIDDDHNGYVDDVIGWDAVSYDIDLDPVPQVRGPLHFAERPDNDPMDDARENYMAEKYFSKLVVGGGHGTHVAGIIAARINGYRGVGVNPNAVIMPLRALPAVGGGAESGVVEMIKYAVDNGAAVINLSLGNYFPSKYREEAVNYAHDHGVVIVAGAGNDGSNSVLYPAAYPSVLSIGSTSADGNLSFFSNIGKIDFVAPGDQILSVRAKDTNPYCIYSDNCLLGKEVRTTNMVGKNVDSLVASGTSMSTPHVAGLASLILAKNPRLSPDEVKNIMINSADDKGDTGKDGYFGYGLINISRALADMNTNAVFIPTKKWTIKPVITCEDGSALWPTTSSMYGTISELKDGTLRTVKSDLRAYRIGEPLSYTIETDTMAGVVDLDIASGLYYSNGNLARSRESLRMKLPLPHNSFISLGEHVLRWKAQELPEGEYVVNFFANTIFCAPFSWKIDGKVQCENGNAPEPHISQMTYSVWPPGPRKWIDDQPNSNFLQLRG